MSDRTAERLAAFAKKFTPQSLAELVDRAYLQAPLGDFEPASGGPLPERGASAASVSWSFFRDLVVGTGSGGGHTASTTTPIIDAATTLRGYSVIVDSGATIIETGGGTASISVVATAPSAAWVAEGVADTASEPVFSAPIALTPATLRVTAVASRQLLKMSPVAERALGVEMLQAVGRALDTAALGAGGGAAPTGLAGATGRITQAGAALSWATVCDVERQVLVAGNRLERLRYIAHPQSRELLQARERAAGSGYIVESDRIGSIPVAVSNEAPADSMFLGDFAGVVVCFYGGRPTIFINPFRYATSGLIEFTIHAEIGIGIPRPGSFAHFSSIT